jgi:pimeloyl-ACP methyl ester carboxylesterase
VAIAAGLPTRVTALAVAAGMGEVGAWATIDDFEKTDRQLVTLSTKHPALARVALGTMGRLARLSPKTAMRSFVKELSESDRRVIDGLGDPASAMALFTQAFLVSSRGVVDDYRTLGRRWEVDFDAIVVPTRIFQGTDDTMVPARHSTELALMITGAEVVEWPGEGHLGTIAHVDEILEWLASFSPDGAGG